MNKLVIDGVKLISDAYDSVPVFTDADGHQINGLYGAFYKLKELLTSGTYDGLDISFQNN